MKMKMIFILLTFCLQAIAQVKNPYTTLKFDKVILYDFEDITETGKLVVDNNGKPIQKIIKKVELDNSVIKNINYRLGDRKSYGGGTASCFLPHCGLVYFLNNKPVAQVTICLMCNRLYSTLPIPAQNQKKDVPGEVFALVMDGLSKSFRQYINNILTRHKFSHQVNEENSFQNF
jgi:hypothetical protein